GFRQIHGQDIPNIQVGALALWDFAALVGKGQDDGYAIGVGTGSVRLLDVISCFLCGRKIHRLRHWVMDPMLGLAIPYGFVDIRMASTMTPKGSEQLHEFYLSVMLYWIIAHELAHIAAGDVDRSKKNLVRGMSKNVVTLVTDAPRFGTELDAD